MTRRILVVDDNRDSATSLAMLLNMALGAETRTAHDGVEAVEAAAEFKPDVVLMDIGLPQIDGYEAARRIREVPSGKGILIVAVTGWANEEHGQLSKDAAFDGHLVKPIDLDSVTTLLSELQSASKKAGLSLDP